VVVVALLPALGETTGGALTIATLALIPAEPSELDLHTVPALGLLRQAR
jgi:hypothetical protein